MKNKHILVVDDEKNILTSLTAILQDEGYQVSTADNGIDALRIAEETKPDLVMLDIWIPKMDGIETLKALRKNNPNIKVIIISGHGNIETAVTATKLGASDFIEKPLSLDNVLLSIDKALKNPEEPDSQDDHPRHPLSFETKNRANVIPQRTLKNSVVLGGQGLHSGLKTGMILSPAPTNTGIIFGDISTGEKIPAHLDFVESTDYATTLKKDRMIVRTIEHLIAVLHMYGITNLFIKIGEEVPIMDGSAKKFCELIEEGEITNQDEFIDELVIKKTLRVENSRKKDNFISIEPHDRFVIEFTLNNIPPIGNVTFVFEHRDSEYFKKEIAPARTFGFLKDYEKLEGMGLASGGRLSNLILLDEGKVINTTLRFPDEFVRHKILDIIGDLYLLGRPIKGKVRAHMTGHSENIALLKEIRKEIKC